MPEYLNENLFTLQTEISQKQKILTVAKKYKFLLKYSGNSLFFDNKLIKHKFEIHFSNTFFDFETYKFVPHCFTEFQTRVLDMKYEKEAGSSADSKQKLFEFTRYESKIFFFMKSMTYRSIIPYLNLHKNYSMYGSPRTNKFKFINYNTKQKTSEK